MMIVTNPFILLSNALATLKRKWGHIEEARAAVVNTVGHVIEGMLAQETRSADCEISDWLFAKADLGTWYSDLSIYCDLGCQAMGYQHQFFRRVAIPAAQAYNVLINGSDILGQAKAARDILSRTMKDGLLRKAMLQYTEAIIHQMEQQNEQRRHRSKPEYEAPLRSSEFVPTPVSVDAELTGGL